MKPMVTRTVRAVARTCVHHWVIRSPQGAASWGACRKCGKRRRFSNHFDGYDRNNNSDIFADTSSGWKPNWSPPVSDDQVNRALEGPRLAGART